MFIAPEVIDKKYGKECDIWSLGVVLYFTMSGKMPFVGLNQTDLFKKIKEKKLVIPKEFNADLSDLLTKML